MIVHSIIGTVVKASKSDSTSLICDVVDRTISSADLCGRKW